MSINNFSLETPWKLSIVLYYVNYYWLEQFMIVQIGLNFLSVLKHREHYDMLPIWRTSGTQVLVTIINRYYILAYKYF